MKAGTKSASVDVLQRGNFGLSMSFLSLKLFVYGTNLTFSGVQPTITFPSIAPKWDSTNNCLQFEITGFYAPNYDDATISIILPYFYIAFYTNRDLQEWAQTEGINPYEYQCQIAIRSTTDAFDPVLFGQSSHVIRDISESKKYFNYDVSSPYNCNIYSIHKMFQQWADTGKVCFYNASTNEYLDLATISFIDPN